MPSGVGTNKLIIMGFFGKKDDDAKAEDAAAPVATEEAKAKHETEHVDADGKKVEKVGEVCEFC